MLDRSVLGADPTATQPGPPAVTADTRPFGSGTFSTAVQVSPETAIGVAVGVGAGVAEGPMDGDGVTRTIVGDALSVGLHARRSAHTDATILADDPRCRGADAPSAGRGAPLRAVVPIKASLRCASVNLYSACYLARQIVYAANWTWNGTHTIRIVNLDFGPPAHRRRRVRPSLSPLAEGLSPLPAKHVV